MIIQYFFFNNDIDPIRNYLNQKRENLKLNEFNIKRNGIKNLIIYGHAAMAGGCGAIPGLDIAMAIILSENMTDLLFAIYGNVDDDNRNTVIGVLNGSVKVGQFAHIGFELFNILKAINAARIALTAGQIVGKVFDLTIIGIVIGQAISVTANTTFLIVSGKQTVKFLKRLEAQNNNNVI